jgi:uncharacterized protein involved in outer membrane biogenesis
VSLSLFTDFPRISVGFRQVYLQEANGNDTLLAAQGVSVAIDVWRLISTGDVRLNGIRISEGQVHVRRDARGRWNYDVLRKDSTQGLSSALTIDLLRLDRTSISFDDRKSRVSVSVFSERSELSGRFEPGDVQIGIDLNGKLNEVIAPQFVSGGPFDLRTEGDITIKNGAVSLTDLESKIHSIPFTFNGKWVNKDRKLESEMAIDIEGAELSQVAALWRTQPQWLADILPSGMADADVTIKGKSGKKSLWSMNVDVTVDEAKGMTQRGEFWVKGTKAQIEYADMSDQSTFRARLSQLNIGAEHSEVEGRLELNGLDRISFDAELKGDLDLADVLMLASADSTSKASGTVNIDLKGKGTLARDADGRTAITDGSWEMAADGRNLGAQLNGTPSIEGLDMSATLTRDGTCKVQVSAGAVGSLDVSGEVVINELMDVLADASRPVILNGKLNISRMDVEQASREWLGGAGAATGGTGRTVQLDLDLTIDQLIYREFVAEEITTRLHMLPGTIVADELKLQCLGGDIAADVRIATGNDRSHLALMARLNGLDVSRLFREWDNFGQDMLTHKHLRGTVTADLILDLDLDSHLKVIANSVRAETDLSISGGELIGFSPLKSLSKFIDVKELEQVRFETLSNHFTLRDGRISIPYMTMRSSAIDFDVFGEQAIGGEMDYHINLLLSDLLGRKARKRKEIEGHEIIEESGRTRLFLWLRGTPGNLKVGLDQREVRKKLARDMKDEGVQLRQIFKEEFGRRNAEPARPAPLAAPDQAQPAQGQPEKKNGTEGKWEIEFE